MKAHPADLWERAKKALIVAKSLLALDSDAAASRAYYAVFYAVSARFALEDKRFTKHSAVEAAVHRDLVKPGTWPKELGEIYSELVSLRRTGDYGEGQHVPEEDAERAVAIAGEILKAVARGNPEEFTGLEDALPPNRTTA